MPFILYVYPLLFIKLQWRSNPNNPVVILRFAISSDSADRGRSIIRVRGVAED